MISFTGKVIIITGAASGLGADAARYIAKLGGSVALVDINAKGINELVDQIKIDQSPNPLAIVADVTKDAERIINETIQHFGKLDVLVNSAGIGREKNIMNSDISIFDELMNTNVRSIVILTKLAVPHLEKTRGNIVNVSSIAGIVPVKYTFYGMGKAALDHFSRSAANEFGARNIRVNTVNPSFVITPMVEYTHSPEQIAYIKKQCKERYPIGRCGEVEEVSAAIAFLASDAASFITGIQRIFFVIKKNALHFSTYFWFQAFN